MARKNNILKEKKKLGVKFYSILSSVIAVLLIGTIILLICLYNHFNTDTYRNRFSEWTEHKINYDELDDIVKDSKVNNMFIFVYDETYMDQAEIDDLDSDDPQRSSYEKANQALEALYQAIMENQEAYEENDSNFYKRVEFYVINTSIEGNNAILSDETYGSVTSAPSLIYIYGDKVSTTNPFEEDDVLTGGSGSYTTLTQVLRDARYFVTEIPNNVTV